MIIDLNKGWHFTSNRGADMEVWLPHDAMLQEKRDLKCHNGGQTGFFPGGKYTYSRSFYCPNEWEGKKAALMFEGAYRNARIEVNGQNVGNHGYGYTEFTVDISHEIHPGDNEITIYLDNSLEPNCRWYSGSGLYRPVWLMIDELEAPRITTKSIEPAVIQVEAEDGATVTVLDKDTLVFEGVPGEITIPDAKLWSAQRPYLYTCVIRKDGKEYHTSFGIRTLSWSAKTGLCVNGERTLLRGGCIHHDNGVLGACGFSEAEERRVRILKEAGYNAIRSAHNPMSRAMLTACDRLGMYVMDEAFDGWYTPKTYHDHSRSFMEEWRENLKAMVDKDFNHPSVIMYSIGNEVSETASSRGVELCSAMTEHMHELDDSRPVTCGVNVLLNVFTNMGFGVYKDKAAYEAVPLPPKKEEKKEKKNGSAFFNACAQKLGGLLFFMSSGKKGDKASKGAAGALDIIGLNYAASRYDADVANYPERMMVGSETMVTDLPYNWERVKKYPAVIGDFVWASWDYLGEAGVGDWMYHSYPGLPLLAGSGTIDITGKITAEAYYQQIIWGLRKEPWMGVQPLNHAGETPKKSAWRFTNAIDSWNWHGYEGKDTVVEVYSDASKIRLELNGHEVATRRVRDYRTKFKMAYLPGELVAVALDSSGRETGRTSLKTGGKERVFKLMPEEASIVPGGLCIMPIEITDHNGLLHPAAEIPVTVKLEGAASLQGLGSALCKTNESYLSDTFMSYRGRLLAVIRAGAEPGDARIIVSGEEMDPAETKLTVGQN